MDSRFDDILHTVISEKGQGIYGFFDVVFGFMYRRTDFFYEMAPNENMGFFPGQAEAIVYNFLKKYQTIHYKERVPKRDIDQKEVEEFIKNQKEKKGGVSTDFKKESVKIENKSTTDENKEVSKLEQPSNTEIKEENKENVDSKVTNNKTTESKTTTIHKEVKVIPISTYNGDSCDNYNWSQGVNEVNIQIKLPPINNSKDLKVTMNNTKVTIELVKNKEVYFDAEFCEKIKADESHWSIEDNKYIILYLDKAQEVIWKSAFKGHKEIDTKTVDNSKKIDEFDTETQAALNKIVYEQNRKRAGLPTTEEEIKLKSLKEAWDATDSPFKGQPFDPSMFNLNEPIYYNTPDYEAKLRAKKEQEEQNK